MKKKIVLFVLCMLLISIASIHITAAYLTDEVGFAYTYTMGDIEIILDEVSVDKLGVPIDNTSRVQKNNYHLMPGYTYTKDPTITVKAGSSESYIRMLVTINKIKELQEIFGNDFKPELFVNGWNNEIWKSTSVIEREDNSNVYEFRYYKTVKGYENELSKNIKLEPLFESFTIPNHITDEQLEMIKDLEISVIGQAIQIQGFNSENDAWESFDK